MPFCDAVAAYRLRFVCQNSDIFLLIFRFLASSRLSSQGQAHREHIQEVSSGQFESSVRDGGYSDK